MLEELMTRKIRNNLRAHNLTIKPTNAFCAFIIKYEEKVIGFFEITKKVWEHPDYGPRYAKKAFKEWAFRTIRDIKSQNILLTEFLHEDEVEELLYDDEEYWKWDGIEKEHKN
jgi:hypothetical protein